MLNVQKFLLNNSLGKLKENYNILVHKYERFMTLNYSQIESPKNDPITNECRGLILEKEYPYNVVCRSFDRFYNYGENGIFPDNFQEYISWEKRDGTLINLYNYNNEWIASTRKMAYAEGINTQGYNFSDLFFSVIDKNKLKNINKNLVLIFELTSPYNRIVTNYKNTEIKLLSVRNKITGKEFSLHELESFALNSNFELPIKYNFKSYDDVINSYNILKELEEGYVFVNYNTMHRFKMKNPSYLAAAHIRCNGVISPKNIINLIFLNDYEEYLLLFPEDNRYFKPYIKAYNNLVNDTIKLYKKYKYIEDQKEFALAIQDLKCKNLLFGLRQGKTLSELFSKLTNNSKISFIEKYL
jgi:hypothetical protein